MPTLLMLVPPAALPNDKTFSLVIRPANSVFVLRPPIEYVVMVPPEPPPPPRIAPEVPAKEPNVIVFPPDGPRVNIVIPSPSTSAVFCSEFDAESIDVIHYVAGVGVQNESPGAAGCYPR